MIWTSFSPPLTALTLAHTHTHTQAYFPQAKHITIKDCSHWVQAEKPREFVQELEVFLRQKTSSSS